VRHVSLRLCAQARTVDDVVQAVVAMLRRHGRPAAHVAAHSFGTFVAAHLRHLYPATVRSLLLADPVCMLTCCPQLLQNFVYRGATLWDLVRRPMLFLKARPLPGALCMIVLFLHY
jgi:pimeloyl-ACP methyl ester carboxylesterase